MDRTEQQKSTDQPVVSPLAKDQTYGERKYHAIFDWGVNYWLNLFASAGFSHWAEHATRPFKLPLLMKEAATPRQIQQNLARRLEKIIPKLPFVKGMEGVVLTERSMAVARSATLLTPGFFIMIPSVWLGAKIKPWLIETFDRRHYGEEAMEDPSLKARHEAIRAEERPTFSGAFVARMATAVTAQLAALTIGSDSNFITKLGKKRNIPALEKVAIDPITQKVGEAMGGLVPEGAQAYANGFLQRRGFDFSEEQRLKFGKTGAYNSATKDFGRFVAADTFYTLITAATIRPFVKLLRHLPFMSYKPKVAENTASFEGDHIKVPKNRYAFAGLEAANSADFAPDRSEAPAPEIAPKPHMHISSIPPHPHGHHKPGAQVSHAAHDSTLHPQHAQAAKAAGA
ncbi:MAG: hypothetical protein SFW64_05640 [Alphaproteobacteria bacterium]|nr:hypothetical protein [Alphaproteobacteria bacterium]